MINILYVSLLDKDAASGGEIGRRNNRLALGCIQNLICQEYYLSLKRTVFGKVFSVLLGFKCGLSYHHERIILRCITNNAINIVFLDTSLYGKLAKVIKKNTSAKIISFFHNCEYEIYRQSMPENIFSKLLLRSVFVNECFSMEYSDVCIFLTRRDYINCKGRYSIDCNHFFSPIALENTYGVRKIISWNIPKRLLFVGSYFYPNIRGLSWFINTILPLVDYELVVVGKGFEKPDFMSQLVDTSKVMFKGFVQNLDEEYENADIVVQPVFEGSGMKTKTAECFMYGKPLVSTSEGLTGYKKDLEYVFECDTKEEFVDVLQNLSRKELPSFCKNLRDVFENCYSLKARATNYERLIKRIAYE